MRRFILALILLMAVLAAQAQQQPVELKLSQSLLALKMTDPLKQFDAFSQLIEMVSGVAAMAGPASPQFDPQTLREQIAKKIDLPGVNTKGDFWFIMLPPAKAAGGADAAAGAKEATPPKSSCALLMPLADAQAFTKNQQKQPGQLAGVVVGNYALVSEDKTLRQTTALTFDLSMHTKREIALMLQVSKGDFTFSDATADKAPPQLLQKFSDVLQNYQRNLQQVEVGVSMVGNDVSAEYFLVPKPGGALEHCLAAQQNDKTALEYAGYLPTDLAYCSASGPMLDGAPGAARLVLDFAIGLLGIFLPAEQSDAFGKSMEVLMTQCSQGRALGILAPPVKTSASATLVGIYHVTSAQEAKTALRNFLQQVQKMRTALFDGVLVNVFTLDVKPEAETLGDTKVDVIEFDVTQNENPAKDNAATTPATPAAPAQLHFPARIAYLNDKMLLTFGGDSKAQMEALLARIKNKTPGFTTSARFRAMKTILPEQLHGFEAYSTLDLARAGVNTFAPEDKRTEALKLLSIFPPQQLPLTTYQELQGGLVHGEIRLPGKQLDFAYTLLKSISELQGNAATAKPGN